MLRRRPRHRDADRARLRIHLAIPLALAACGSLILGAAGCGGDSGSEEIDSALLAPSKLDYISRADGLCGFYQDRTERQGREALGLSPGDFKIADSGRVTFKPGRRPPDSQIVAFVTDIAVPNLTDELGELRAIQPPTGDEPALTEVYDATEQAVQALGADPSVALDEAKMKALFGRPLQVARAYGFRVCGARPPTLPAG